MALPMHEAYRRDIAGRGSGIPDLLPDYLDRIGREKLLDHGQEIRLSHQAQDGDRRARNTLVEDLVQMVRELARARAELAADLGREPNEGEIARRLGWGVEKLRLAISSMPDAMSLERPVGIESGSVGDFTEDVRTSDAPGTVTREIEIEQLRRAVESLPERECYVLIRRYGLDGHATDFFSRLAKKLGISRDQIRSCRKERSGCSSRGKANDSAVRWRRASWTGH